MNKRVKDLEQQVAQLKLQAAVHNELIMSLTTVYLASMASLLSQDAIDKPLFRERFEELTTLMLKLFYGEPDSAEYVAPSNGFTFLKSQVDLYANEADPAAREQHAPAP